METSTKPKREKEHYVNNKEFGQAVVDYVNESNALKAEGKEPNIIPEYIGRCFMKIAAGLSLAPNFKDYTWRDEMVMDAIENCVKVILNYDVTASTRSGIPNAFGYFTQISYFAFLRRMAQEKKQYAIKLKYIETANIGSFADFGDDGHEGGDGLIEKMRGRTDSIKHRDDSFITDDSHKPYVPPKRKIANRGWPKKVKAISSALLTDFQ